RRERESPRLPEQDGRRSIHPPRVAEIVGAPSSLLVEEDDLAVVGNVVGVGPVEPGQVAFARLARSDSDDLAAIVRPLREHASVGGDVLRQEAPGKGRDWALRSRGRDAEQRAPGAETDAGARRPPDPRVPAEGGTGDPRTRLRIQDEEPSGAVSSLRVVVEGDPTSVGRESRVAEPARRLI